MRRRVRRLYPVFLCVMALYLALSYVFPQESTIPAQPRSAPAYIGANLLMLPGMLAIQPIITVTWSLSYEIFYYLAVPLVISQLRLRTWTPRTRMALFTLLAIGLVFKIPHIGGRSRSAMFISGMLSFEVIETGTTARLPTTFAVLALVASWFVMAPAFDPAVNLALRIGVLFIAFYGLCLACFSAPGRAGAITFSWTPLR